MNAPRKTAENHLVFEGQIGKGFADMKSSSLPNSWFWSSRLILIQDKSSTENDASYSFIATDLLTNEKRQILFRKSDGHHTLYPHIYSLTNGFGIITESSRFSNCHCINLVEFDWDKNEFELVQKIDVNYSNFEILVDQSDPSKFAMKWTTNRYNFQVCKLVNGKIEFGEIHQFNTNFEHYSNDKLVLVFSDIVIVYDLTLKEHDAFELFKSFLHKNFYFSTDTCALFGNRLYAKLKLQNSGNYGIVWVDLTKTEKRWTLLDFEANLSVEKLQFFGENLVVVTKSKKSIERKVFSIQMRRPQSLRKMSWICVVNVMKNRGEENPYEATKEFLPLNSDLRELWFKDEEVPKKK